ncbi:hypothetical protein BC937DRAFT_95242 [Endogone sp. FLAS-F59071]|nr:hypothetical protein BC937DRAFT_95242 [Endogone sp. FLAS-F59071]|eukprot:RUS13491.1 hypothetical protein BC937DRAFT_95242 [Endogone sp. FLAS-F59071]
MSCCFETAPYNPRPPILERDIPGLSCTGYPTRFHESSKALSPFSTGLSFIMMRNCSSTLVFRPFPSSSIFPSTSSLPFYSGLTSSFSPANSSALGVTSPTSFHSPLPTAPGRICVIIRTAFGPTRSSRSLPPHIDLYSLRCAHCFVPSCMRLARRAAC